jgi:uncharacterized protein
MRYWDSSAIVPLLFEEAESETVGGLVRDDPELVTWVFSPIEILSALWRRRRAGELEEVEHELAEGLLRSLEESWVAVTDVASVERRARRLLSLHLLRATDALQLAAALIACDERTHALPFVTLDARLAEAARREGFSVPQR